MDPTKNRFAALASDGKKQTNLQPAPRPAGSRRVDQRQQSPSYSDVVASSHAVSFPPLKASKQSATRSNDESKAWLGKLGTSHPVLTKDAPGGPSPKIAAPSAETRCESPAKRSQETHFELSDNNQAMNEHLSERFGRRKAVQKADAASTNAGLLRLSALNYDIRRYVKTINLSHPAIPSAEEIHDSGNRSIREPISVAENVVVGPFRSKDDYIERHYGLLREDAVAPLRAVVSEVQAYSHIEEKDSQCNAYLYEKVFITGLTFANSGIAARVTFSLRRVGKRVNWEQSKRLLTGTIVALTPVNDAFKTCCRVAVVAARPIAGLNQNPPEIDIFFGGADQVEIDPQQEFLMVESRNGFYEGYRHTLQSLQMLSKEDFPLSEHIVNLAREIPPPTYIGAQPQKDLSKLFDNVDNVDILTEWPNSPCPLDESQTDALRRILTKKLALVQGPPGTGKTHVSVMAIKLIVANMTQDDAPILVAAHTNHALDQLLRHVAVFEPQFIRLGGWTKDFEIIKPRTLHEIKTAMRYNNPLGCLRGPAVTKIRQLAKEMTLLLEPLAQDDGLLSAALFHKYSVITAGQYASLIEGSKEWVRVGADANTTGEIAIWLGDELVEAKQRTMPEDFGIEIEEADLEYEQLKELEAESKLVDDEDAETLRGPRIVFSEPYTGRKAVGVTEETVKMELKKKDFWKIPPDHRGPVYRYISALAKERICIKLRTMSQQYEKASQEAKIGGWEIDYNFLKEARVIGATTTGLSKYRGLLQALNPKIVMIEEAAETLEGPIAVACFKTLEHLILVGDHQQLRAHTNEEELAGKPFFLDISMMERLIRNGVEFSQLNCQRRMIPEISRLLSPIYESLQDHPAVLTKPPVPGMGVNSYFFTHEWRESKDSQMSTMNDQEAIMVAGFFIYLIENGMEASDITVITMYNAQRKSILRKLRERRPEKFYNVVTVDSYQGEENAVILLSLAKNNADGKIGFLESENRICVALSRAQRGLYVWGDGPALCKASMLWFQIIQMMGKNPRRVGFYLPVTCQKHQRTTFIQNPHELSDLDGGCTLPCQERLDCGHTCQMKCHPFTHSQISCEQGDCGASNEIDKAPATSLTQGKEQAAGFTSYPLKEQQRPYETRHFRHYAAGGHVNSDQNLAKLAEHDRENAERKRLDEQSFDALFGDLSAPTRRSDNVELVGTRSNGKGLWKGSFAVRRAENTKPRKEEGSLLDLP